MVMKKCQLLWLLVLQKSQQSLGEAKWPNQGLKRLLLLRACTWTHNFSLCVQDTLYWKSTNPPFCKKLVPEKALRTYLYTNLPAHLSILISLGNEPNQFGRNLGKERQGTSHTAFINERKQNKGKRKTENPPAPWATLEGLLIRHG